MPHVIIDARDQEVEVLTTDDLSTAAWRIIRWFGGSGLLLLVTAVVMWVRLDSRVASVERTTAAAAEDRDESLDRVARLQKSVDSLVIVIGNNTELLRDIRRGLR